MHTTKRASAVLGASFLIASAGLTTLGTSSADAAGRDGACDGGEFCYYYNSNQAGSVSDFTGSIGDYGAAQPGCYDFKSEGAGKGVCVKNNAASVWNRTDKPVKVFFNSGYGGASQEIAPGAKANLNGTLKNNNASHQVGSSGGGGSQFWVPFPCGEAWAGQTRTNHRPQLSVDFNHNPDEGWKVFASAPGTVSKVANLGNTSYGRYIVIDHGGGWQTLYAHLSAQNVSVGQKVTETTFIGRVGNTGGSSGAHLHYEQKLNGSAVKVTFKSGNAVYYGTKSFQRASSCPA